MIVSVFNRRVLGQYIFKYRNSPFSFLLLLFLCQRTAADHILRDLQNNPDMWLQVVHILSNAQNLNTKFFALQVCEYGQDVVLAMGFVF